MTNAQELQGNSLCHITRMHISVCFCHRLCSAVQGSAEQNIPVCSGRNAGEQHLDSHFNFITQCSTYMKY